jgi:hypothetical protein
MPDPINARNYHALPLAERLEEAHRIIGVLETHAEIQAGLAPFEYDAAKFTEGRTLVDAALQEFDDQIQAYGSKKQASARKTRAFQDATEEWQRLAGIAEIVYRDEPETLDALGTRNFPRRQAQQLGRFRQFSTAARAPEHAARLAPKGVDEDALTAFDALVTAADTADHTAGNTRAAAQTSTEGRDDEADDIDAYIRDVQDFGRIAFEDRPQLLEYLGIRVR